MERERLLFESTRRSAAGLVTLILLSTVACQTTTSFVGDQYYESGRLPEAEAAFVEYLESDATDAETASRAMYRLAVIYATPANPAYDPQRSIEMLDRLVESHPQSRFTSEAMLLRRLLSRSGEEEARRAELVAQIKHLESEIERRETDLYLLQRELGVKEGELTQVVASIPPLEARIEELTDQLEAKEQELEQLDRLKAIDLESPPPRDRR